MVLHPVGLQRMGLLIPTLVRQVMGVKIQYYMTKDEAIEIGLGVMLKDSLEHVNKVIQVIN